MKEDKVNNAMFFKQWAIENTLWNYFVWLRSSVSVENLKFSGMIDISFVECTRGIKFSSVTSGCHWKWNKDYELLNFIYDFLFLLPKSYQRHLHNLYDWKIFYFRKYFSDICLDILLKYFFSDFVRARFQWPSD